MSKIGSQHCIFDRTIGSAVLGRLRLLDAPAMIDRDARLGSVFNVGNRIEHLFLAAVQMMLPLFSDGRLVEI